MNNDKIEDTIFEVIENITNIDKNTIRNNYLNKINPEWDSLAQVRIILEIEKKFNIKVSSSKHSDFNNIFQIADYLKNNISD